MPEGVKRMIMMRKKTLFLLPVLCVMLLSCTDRKPVSSVHEEPVLRKDTVSAKKMEVAETVKAKPLTYKILVPFLYRLCDPDTLINRNWAELYQQGKDYYVGKAHYRIRKEEDPCTGDLASDLRGKRKTILFVNQLPIRMGKVQVADVELSDSSYLKPGTVRTFTFSGKRYKLEAKAKGEDIYKNYCLLLNGERIVREAQVDDAWFRLLFAGDLDGDGKLDLVLSVPAHYENLRVVLFLSSCAQGGQQLGKAAEVDDDFSC